MPNELPRTDAASAPSMVRLVAAWLVAMALVTGGVYMLAGTGWAMVTAGAIMLASLEAAVRPRRVRP